MQLKQPAKYLAYVKPENARQSLPGTYEVTDVDWGHELVFVKRTSFTEPCVFNFDEVVLREYTGRRDRNGAPIYQSDIILTDYNEVYDFARYVVVWSDEKAAWYTQCIALHHRMSGFKDISHGGYSVGYLASFPNVEVLGNLYENPELLAESGVPA